MLWLFILPLTVFVLMYSILLHQIKLIMLWSLLCILEYIAEFKVNIVWALTCSALPSTNFGAWDLQKKFVAVNASFVQFKAALHTFLCHKQCIPYSRLCFRILLLWISCSARFFHLVYNCSTLQSDESSYHALTKPFLSQSGFLI